MSDQVETISGEKRNYPFFKFGEISNIPNEPFEVQCVGSTRTHAVRVWYIAANLINGNSGSPIVYAPPALIMPTTPTSRAVVIGIQSSSLIALSDQGENKILEPADIAGMTPIADIFDIIQKNSPSYIDFYRGDEKNRPK